MPARPHTSHHAESGRVPGAVAGQEALLNARETVAALLMLSMVVSAPGLLRAADDPPAPPPGPVPAIPPAPAGAQRATPSAEVTPARVSYINGEVSFSRPGAQDWTPAQVNTPLAPGDALYTGQAGNVEIQVAPRAFVRAAEGTQLSLDNHEADFVQLRVTAGHAAVDLRELAAGHAVELDTPHAAFTLQRPGYYHVDVAEDSTTLRTHRGGGGTMTPAVGMASPIVANQQMVIEGGDSPRVEVGAAPDLTAWDRWNYQRSDYLLQPAGARYVSPTVYGTADLNQYGAWRTVETYGAVWVPALPLRPLGLRRQLLGVGAGSRRRPTGLRASARRLPRRRRESERGRSALLGAARLGRADHSVVGSPGLRRRGVVGRLGRSARRQQRRREPHDRRQQRDEHHGLSERARH